MAVTSGRSVIDLLEEPVAFEEQAAALAMAIARRGADDPAIAAEQAVKYLLAMRGYFRARDGLATLLAARDGLPRWRAAAPPSPQSAQETDRRLSDARDDQVHRLLDANARFLDAQRDLATVVAAPATGRPDALALRRAVAHQVARTGVFARDARPGPAHGHGHGHWDWPGHDLSPDHSAQPAGLGSDAETETETESSAKPELKSAPAPEAAPAPVGDTLAELMEVHEMRRLLDHLSEEVRTFGDEQRDLVSSLREQYSDARDRADLLVLDVEDQKRAAEQLRSLVADFDAANRQMEARLKTERIERETAQTRVTALEARVAELRAELARLSRGHSG
ncbi:MAG: hypothetical protein HY719_15120 [Planctomycetes bacterium]|nr:hypothetical protein [Planctomycetota bacterium]